MCSGSEAGSYLRLIDFVYHSTLGLRVMKKRRRKAFKAASDRRGDDLKAAVASGPVALPPTPGSVPRLGGKGER